MKPGDELDNLYARLKGIHQLQGAMTSQTPKDVNWIVARLCNLRVLTQSEGFSLRVNEFVGIERAEFSGIPERAAQVMAILESRRSKALLIWAMQKPIALAVVFSDVTDSVVLNKRLGEVKWQEILEAHFASARILVEKNGGFFVKDIGDALMALFHDAASALDFTIELRKNPVDSQIAVRQGAHIGEVIVKLNDAVGQNVNKASRIAAKAKRGAIVMSEEFFNDVQRINSPAHARLPWQKSPNNRMKGFDGTFVLWKV